MDHVDDVVVSSSQCSPCGGSLTVDNLLVACSAVMPVRQQFFNEQTLSAVFGNVSSRKIVDFIKATDFYCTLIS
jgi:hypothetical protein